MSDYPDYEYLRVVRDGAHLHITFNRPDRRNALTHAMMEEICDAASRAACDDSLRVVILRGAGGNFCAGGDLDFMADMPPPPMPGETDPLYAPYRGLGDGLEALNALPQAVVAVVEGAAVGGGLGMVCCADVVIVHAGAKLGMPEPRAGFIPSQVIPFVVRRIGEAHARRIAVMGAVVDGRVACQLAIAHYMCATPAEIETKLAWVLGEIRRCEPQAVAAVKRLVLSVAEKDDTAVMDDAAAALVDLLRRPQAPAGIAAFRARKPPPWAE